VALLDPDFGSFRNINTPEDYFRLRGDERANAEVPADFCADASSGAMMR